MLKGTFGIRTNEAWRRFAATTRGFAGREQGQSMVEYSIVAALIAIVSMTAVQALGGGIATVFQNILNKIQGI